MQYDVQRSVPSVKDDRKAGDSAAPKAKPAKPGRGASAKGNSPPLRDRLREVLERDRALADSLPAPERERPLDSRYGDEHDERDVPAKSGTHARLPDYTRGQPERLPSQPPPLRRQPTRPVRQEPEAASVFASWIEAELVELDDHEEPLSLTPEPAPRQHRLSLPPSSSSHLSSDELQPSLEPVVSGPELVLDFETALLTDPSDDDLDEVTDPLLAAPGDDTLFELPRLPLHATQRVEPEYTPSAAVLAEPIRTRTMARLLSGHGYRGRALAIYDHLLALDPDDLELLLEAEALRSKK